MAGEPPWRCRSSFASHHRLLPSAGSHAYCLLPVGQDLPTMLVSSPHCPLSLSQGFESSAPLLTDRELPRELPSCIQYQWLQTTRLSGMFNVTSHLLLANPQQALQVCLLLLSPTPTHEGTATANVLSFDGSLPIYPSYSVLYLSRRSAAHSINLDSWGLNSAGHSTSSKILLCAPGAITIASVRQVVFRFPEVQRRRRREAVQADTYTVSPPRGASSRL